MNICIFGGTGQTGRLFIEQALEAGHKITVFARSPDKLSDLADKIHIVSGSIENKIDIAKAIIGQDIIVSALGSKEPDPKNLLENTTTHIINSMKEHNVRRIIAVTSLGCRESIKLIENPRFLAMINGPYRPNWDDKSGQEDVIENSGIDYTIVRPGGLTNDTNLTKYEVAGQYDPVPQDKLMIARINVANFLLKAIDDPSTINKVLSIYA